MRRPAPISGSTCCGLSGRISPPNPRTAGPNVGPPRRVPPRAAGSVPCVVFCIARCLLEHDNMSHTSNGSLRAPEIHPNQLRTLRLLLEHADVAERLDRPRWEFALDLRRLSAAGVTVRDLGELIRQQAIEHRLEISGPRSRGRRFQELPIRRTSIQRTPFRRTPLQWTSGVALAPRGGRRMAVPCFPHRVPTCCNSGCRGRR